MTDELSRLEEIRSGLKRSAEAFWRAGDLEDMAIAERQIMELDERIREVRSRRMAG
jgi:hypothetical protein